MTERYAVHSETRDGVDVFTLQQGSEARAEIAPGLGNNCFAFQTALPILEPIPFDQFCAKPTSYGIPLLFPFPNRIRDGVFTFAGEQFRVDPPRHGFVRDKAWQVVASGSSATDGAWIRSRLDARDFADAILKQFPFPFVIEVTYRLRDSQLELRVEAENTGTRSMPTGFGIHPYFRLPERGSIQVPAAQRWELQESLPIGKLLELDANYDLRTMRGLAGLNLDDIYTAPIADESGVVRCRLNDEVNRVQTVVEFSATEFPNIVVFTPPAPRQAICIEPNSCPTDAFNLHEKGIDSNVIALAPGERAAFTVLMYSQSL